MKILQTIYEFRNKATNTDCGLYHVELNSGAKHYLLRNDDSVGAVCHYLGRPASECVSIIRENVKQDFLSLLKSSLKGE